jgi:hypothetical protein
MLSEISLPALDDFTDSQPAIFPFADLPKSSRSIGLEIGNIGANKEESP